MDCRWTVTFGVAGHGSFSGLKVIRSEQSRGLGETVREADLNEAAAAADAFACG
jgi:hypothetical protein